MVDQLKIVGGAVKFNLKGGLFSCIFPKDAAICQKIQFCSQTGHFLPDFQIAVTHSILKLKSILIPPDKMTWSGEKHAQD